MLRVGKLVLSGTSISYSIPMFSPESTCTRNIVQNEQVIASYISMYTFACNSNFSKCHEFKREQRAVSEEAQRDERERKHNIII